jgi:GTP-binding protein
MSDTIGHDHPLAQVEFLLSAPHARAFPPDDRPEVAFAGRSNAGKSSALNVLCGRRKLARTSKTPGRTQALNFFVAGDGRLVDLPGYGFARVPAAVRAAWQALVENYLARRQGLRGVILLMDSRHPLTDFDRQLLDWGAARGLAFHVLLTKADKLGRGARTRTLREVQAALPEHGVQLFSATHRTGVDEARARVEIWLTEKP